MIDGEKLYGKYRGRVVENVDPMQIGRVQVVVPDVSSSTLPNWAIPCVPVGGVRNGVYEVPSIGANVWLEFERGDPSNPIWVGCF